MLFPTVWKHYSWALRGGGVPDVSNVPGRLLPASIRREHPGIALLLSRWTESVRRHDLGSHMNCYSPVLERYFNETNVPRAAVRADEERAFLLFSSLRVKLKGVRIFPESHYRAVVEFAKSWDFKRRFGKPFAGSDYERLIVVKGRAGWEIVSEREVHAPRRRGPDD